MQSSRAHFTTRLGIILATAGSSVGLGNIWRFPVETGQNGGAAFILIYLVCVVFLGVPMMTAEFIIGRHTHTDITSAYEQLSREARPAGRAGVSRLFTLTGYAGMVCVTLILGYYSVVAGWVLKYAFDALTAQLAGGGDAAAAFATYSSSVWGPLLCTLAFILLTHLVIVRGVQNGIERFSKLLMPLLLLLLLLLAAGALAMPGAGAGLRFLLRPDFSKITSAVVLSALGQAFFSLSIAIGCLSTYASYFRPDVPLLRTAANVVGIDTAVAILAGFIIFPAVFSVPGVAPDAGPGLVFVTLPSVFSSLFGGLPVAGYVFALMFYLLLLLAALTSTISMHEEVTAFFVDRYHVSRPRAAARMTAVSMVLGALCSLSFHSPLTLDLSAVAPLCEKLAALTVRLSFFDLFNDLTAVWIMPLSGIVLSLFVGWRLPRALVLEELTSGGVHSLPAWLCSLFFFLIRWVAPLAITLIFLSGLWG